MSCGKLISFTHRKKGQGMQVELEVIAQQVLKLSSQDRAQLLDRLILSSDDDKARDAAWDSVAAKRDVEVEDGSVAEIDGPEALARLRANFR